MAEKMYAHEAAPLPTLRYDAGRPRARGLARAMAEHHAVAAWGWWQCAVTAHKWTGNSNPTYRLAMERALTAYELATVWSWLNEAHSDPDEVACEFLTEFAEPFEPADLESNLRYEVEGYAGIDPDRIAPYADAGPPEAVTRVSALLDQRKERTNG